MNNVIYKKLIDEVSINFKKNLTDEQYNELLPCFLDYIALQYGNMFEVIEDENNSFYQNAIRKECLKICELDYINKKALLIKDNNLSTLSALSFRVFDRAKQKLVSGINTITEQEALAIKNKASELYEGVYEYNKKKASILMSELQLDLIYCYKDTKIVSLRLAPLVNIKKS